MLWALFFCGLLLGHAPPVIPHGAQSGDLIFRKGTEAVSDLVRSLDSDGEFSHVGILIAANEVAPELLAAGDFPLGSEWLVLHATPSELESRSDSVVLDSLSFFTSPKRSTGHAVYRVANADPAQRRATVATARSCLTRHG